MVTEYMNNCILCGRPTDNVHHLVYGNSHRKLADQDELVIGLCLKHHNEIHANSSMGIMSKIIGQLAYERDLCAKGSTQNEAREQFRKRYGSSYL